MRKICVVTGTRAEYGLLYWLMKEIQADENLDLQLIVTGMHLSPEFGFTFKEIEKEFLINKKIEILLSSDTSIGISKSMGLAQISFAEAYAELAPDIVVLLGDRFEIFSAASAAMISRIPIAHIHGGEITEGAFDEAIRHSITKMSHLHFVATKVYRQRVIQLGEDPEKVYNFGAPSLDNICNIKLLSKEEFEKSIDFKLGNKNLLVTFHPVTLEQNTEKEQFQQLLNAFDELDDTHIIFTKANADIGGRSINMMIDSYVLANPNRSIAFASLGQVRYLSALKYIDAVVGNSSSGLIEAPSFNIGVVNIGDRQKGRIKAGNVIDCEPDKKQIKSSISRIYTTEFQQVLSDLSNPYGVGGASKKISSILSSHTLENLLKKKFIDLPIPQ